jgi:hypothetical protein
MTHEHTPKKVFLALYIVQYTSYFTKEKKLFELRIFWDNYERFFCDRRKSLKP